MKHVRQHIYHLRMYWKLTAETCTKTNKTYIQTYIQNKNIHMISPVIYIVIYIIYMTYITYNGGAIFYHVNITYHFKKHRCIHHNIYSCMHIYIYNVYIQNMQKMQCQLCGAPGHNGGHLVVLNGFCTNVSARAHQMTSPSKLFVEKVWLVCL